MAVTQETTTRPTNDAYTGMLGISLFALVLGCVLLYLDYSQYPDSKAPLPKAPPVAAGDDKGAGDATQKVPPPPQKKALDTPKETAPPEPKADDDKK
jgi:hypothetical protein